MTEWRFISSGICTASFNMAIDEAIAINVRDGKYLPTLRLYGWERPAVSLGLFQKTTGLNMEYCAANNIPVVRRPTGGRAILHGSELTYSFSSRHEGLFAGSLLNTYRQISLAFKKAFNKIGLQVTVKNKRESGENLIRSPLCFRTTSYGEITFHGEKIIGSAQKRWKDGFLQQGSIPYKIDAEALKKIFNAGTTCGFQKELKGLKDAVISLDDTDFRACIRTAFEETFRIKFIQSEPSHEEFVLARELDSRKYLYCRQEAL